MLRKRGEAKPNQSAPQCSFWQQLSFARAYRLWPLPSYGNDGDDDVMQLGGDDDECTSRLSMFILATAWNEAKFLRIVLALGCFVRKGDFCDRRTHMPFSQQEHILKHINIHMGY